MSEWREKVGRLDGMESEGWVLRRWQRKKIRKMDAKTNDVSKKSDEQSKSQG